MKNLAVLAVFLLSANWLHAQCFENSGSYVVDTLPLRIISGQFNNDTILDLATLSYSHETVSVLLGNGNGTFSLAGNFPTGQNPSSLTSGDLDRDGDMDIITVNYSSVTVLLNNGNGTFAAPIDSSLFGGGNGDIVSGDFNNDSIADVAFTRTITDQVLIYLGNGDGTIAYDTTLGAGNYPQWISTADFNRDGITDLVGSSSFNSSIDLVSLYYGNANGTFRRPYPWVTNYAGPDMAQVRAADLNGDSIPDVVSANRGISHGHSFDVLLSNDTSGQFAPSTQYSIGFGADKVLLDDFNGDGFTDIMAGGYYNNFTIVPNDGTGDFSGYQYPYYLWGVRDFVSGDFNGDGIRDVAGMVTSSNRVFILLGRPQPTGTMITTPANCQNLGSISANVTSGQPPYNYEWNNWDSVATLTNVSSGIYSVTVTDSFGCFLYLSDTIQSAIIHIDSTQIADVTCDLASDGAIEMFATGGIPPLVYQWSTGDTTPLIDNLVSGTYMLTLTDSAGCFTTQTITVDETGLQTDILVLGSAGGCSGPADGALRGVALNGYPPYTYHWSTGGTTDSIGNLYPGGYSLTTTDSIGCVAVRHEFVPSDVSCYSTLTGTVFYDLDTNCVESPGDLGLSNRLVVINPGYYALTNSNGDWTAVVEAGSYDITTGYTPVCGIDTISISTVGTVSYDSLDFPRLVPNPNDVSVTLNCDVPRPGFEQALTITIRNQGIFLANISGSFTPDAAITNVRTIQVPSNLIIDNISPSVPHILNFHIDNLAPQQQVRLKVFAQIPGLSVASIGQNISNSVSVNLTNATDANLGNNSYYCNHHVTGSYDPNDKAVYADEQDVDGLAPSEDTLFTYRIRFQNTGNDTAFNVFIRDTLDSDLEVASFHLVSSSHPVTVEFFEGHIVRFNFNNIMLPDSIVNEPESHGFVEYQIQVEDAAQRDPIMNTAAIYFDYNPPIFTNTVSTLRVDMPEILGESAMCDGDSIDLTASFTPTNNYFWGRNNVGISGGAGTSVTVTDSGSYQIFLTHADDTLGSAIHYVTVNPNPQVSLMLPSDTVCSDTRPLELLGYTSPTGGEFSGDGISGHELDISSGGTYNVSYTYTNTNGCSAKDVATVFVDVCEGIQSIDNGAVNVYPNPTTGLMIIDLGGQPVDEIILFDVTGRKVLVQQYKGLGQVKIDAGTLSKGMHLLRVRSGDNWYQHKVIIAR